MIRRSLPVMAAALLGIAAGAALLLAGEDADVQPPRNGPLLHAELHRRIAVGDKPQRQLAFSPDGSLLATSTVDGAIRLWPTARRGPPRVLIHRGGATSLAFSGDGRVLASGGYDGKVRLWRVADGAPLRVLAGHRGTVWTVDFSPDGTRIASGGEDRTVRLWRAGDGALLKAMKGHGLNIWAVRFSPDGSRLASGSFDRSIRLWDARTGAAVRTLAGHEEAVVSIEFSPDGRLLASGGDDSTVRLWRAADGAQLRILDATRHVDSLAFSPDGRWLASGGHPRGAPGAFLHQAFGRGGTGKAVRLWRVADGAQLQALDQGDDVMTLAFSPDGRWLAAGSEDGAVTIWRVRSNDRTPG